MHEMRKLMEAVSNKPTSDDITKSIESRINYIKDMIGAFTAELEVRQEELRKHNEKQLGNDMLSTDDMDQLNFAKLIKQAIEHGYIDDDTEDGINILHYENDIIQKLVQDGHLFVDIYSEHFPESIVEYWIDNGLTRADGGDIRDWIEYQRDY